MMGRVAALVMHLRRSTIDEIALVIAGGVPLGLVLLFLQEWLGEGTPGGVRRTQYERQTHVRVQLSLHAV